MSKTAEMAKLPEYVDYSLRDEDYMDGIQLHQSPPRPQYRVFAMDQSSQKTHSRSETSFSDDISLTPSISRSTATQDLADFLKTSNPEDFKRYLSSSSDDLSTSAVSRGGSFRFLKSSTLTSSVKVNATPPVISLTNKSVVPKTTSKGKPYLQIHVDYGESYFGSHTTTSVSQQTSFSSETSSDIYHNSMATGTSAGVGSAVSPRASISGGRSLSPPPPRNAQESKVSLDVATMGRYQQFLDSGIDTKTRSNSIESVSNSYTSDIVSAGMAELRAYQKRERMKSPPRSPGGSSAPYSSSGMGSTRSSPRRHSRPDSMKVRPKSQAISARSSVTSDIFDDITDTEFEGTTGTGPHGQRKKSRKAPPRPGPPPNRSLPSLPENHSDLRPGSEEGCPPSARNSRMSFTSVTGSQFDDAESIRSDRKTREERVKARKAKDINQHKQLMREKNKVRQSLNSSVGGVSRPSSGLGEMGDSSRRGSTSQHSIFSNATSMKSSIAFAENPTSSINSLPNSPSFADNQTHAQHRQSFNSTRTSGSGRPQLPMTPPILSGSTYSSSAREMELEARMLAVERKNKMLEQALMAVIRSTVRGQAQRRTQLFKANDMEELLHELDLEELPVVFTDGQVV